MSVGGLRVVRIGVLGFGRMGALHADNIGQIAGARLVGICDNNSESRERASRLHGVAVHERIDELLEMDLDAVLIATNTQCHAEHIRLCAEAGVGVFTEKPVGLSSMEADAALTAVEASGVAFQIGYQRRWDPDYLEMKRIIDSGGIGEPVFFKAHGRDPDASSVSNWGIDKNGGLFANCAIHDYDISRFFFGREVASVTASGAVLVHKGLEAVGDLDSCSTTLAFEGGGMAVTEWTRFAPHGYDVHAEMIGTHGILQLGSARRGGLTMRRRGKSALTVTSRFERAYRASVVGFVESLRQGVPPSPGVRDARAALQIALTARKSFETGSLKLDLPALGPLQAMDGIAPLG